jgi:hypothetical protein
MAPKRNQILEHLLQPNERPKMMYEYTVTGAGRFPTDMLRHDGAWPATGEDSNKIDYDLRARERRSIRLYSYRRPTIERWNSFQWSVGL